MELAKGRYMELAGLVISVGALGMAVWGWFKACSADKRSRATQEWTGWWCEIHQTANKVAGKKRAKK